MTEENTICPNCTSPYSYQDGHIWICPECSHEWDEQITEEAQKFLDMNGVPLQSGDDIITGIDLKIKGGTIKAGTKVKNIRLLETEVNGHDISCKIEGHGSMYLKCSVVKKA